MTRLRKHSELIRDFLIEKVENNNPKDVIALTMKKFNVSRQAIHKHIKRLVEQGVLIRVRNGAYELRPQEEWRTDIVLAQNPREDVVWRDLIVERIGQLPDNTISIWNYGFTEMFNNVLDHSESETVSIRITKTAYTTEMIIWDHGIGIFNKIKNAMNLIDERHAVIELTKGKLTTNSTTHTGEGIFFTSRMFDTFSILSGEVFLSHVYGDDEDWIMQPQENCQGTWIFMKLKNNTSRTIKEIFDKFSSSEDDYGFTKTVVPVRLAQYGNEKLVSRSQAKRLLERIECFKTVLFDFKEVESIGQSFADEVFRVFANQHRSIEIVPINANVDVMQMVNRARSNTEENIGQGELPFES